MRHPETGWNQQKRYQGWRDIPLSARGEEQCRQLIMQLGQMSSVDAVLSSDLTRCLAVARPLAKRLGKPLHALPELRELDFGAWEGLTFDEVGQRYPSEQADWLDNPSEIAPPGGETLQQMTGRIRQALVAYRQRDIIVVTHGGVIATVLNLWVGQDFWLPETGSCLAVDLERQQCQPYPYQLENETKRP